eukprot:COSAG06_NODE_19800_length_822_cov_1.000000_2_plen_72_part_01
MIIMKEVFHTQNEEQVGSIIHNEFARTSSAITPDASKQAHTARSPADLPARSVDSCRKRLFPSIFPMFVPSL